MATVGGQLINLSPSTLNEFIGITGIDCNASKKCNTPNSYDKTLSKSAAVVEL